MLLLINFCPAHPQLKFDLCGICFAMKYVNGILEHLSDSKNNLFSQSFKHTHHPLFPLTNISINFSLDEEKLG